MKNKISKIMIICLMFTSLLSGCKSILQPEVSVVEDFMKAIKNEDVATVKEMLPKQWFAEMEDLRKLSGIKYVDDDIQLTEDQIKITDDEILEIYISNEIAEWEEATLDWYNQLKFEKIDGNENKAIVSVYIKSWLFFKKHEHRFDLVKDDGEWKVFIPVY